MIAKVLGQLEIMNKEMKIPYSQFLFNLELSKIGLHYKIQVLF